MHGGAATLARQFLEQNLQPDLLLVTDMLDLTTFLALTRAQTAVTPTVLYMHENQLTYPLPSNGRTGPMRRQQGERDHHYVFINYASMLAADKVLFNSQFHFDSWFTAVPNFLKHFPEYNELNSIELLRQKSEVLPVGVDFKRLAIENSRLASKNSQSPLILWNQRWEYDKNPEAFFQALYHIAAEKIPFTLALCGQQYGKQPAIFKEAMQKLEAHIIHNGHADAATYRQLLWQADITISTAVHEFFGISVLEAIYCQTFPILPNRLSYPELLPAPYHLQCLYQNQPGLEQRLKWALAEPGKAQQTAQELATAVAHFDWSQVAPKYDKTFAKLAKKHI